MKDTEEVKKWIVKATAAASDRRFDEAEKLLERVLAIDPHHLRALDIFGFVRYFQGRYEEALKYCVSALEINPNHAYALKGQGLCLAALERLDEGVVSLNKAIAQKPEWVDPHWDLAVVLTQAGHHSEALKVLAKAQVFAPKGRRRFLAFSNQIKQKMDQAGE